jgi:thymidine kinase
VDLPKRGLLEVICGPMFGGKSALLLKRLQDYGQYALLVKPSYDTRFAHDSVVSRTGLSAPAISISKWPSHLPYRTSAIFIDEVHFMRSPMFEGDMLSIVCTLLEMGMDVIASGLDSDYMGIPFDVTQALREIADKVTLLSARCSGCSQPASRTFKKTTEAGGRFDLGDCDIYEPRCETCWTS